MVHDIGKGLAGPGAGTPKYTALTDQRTAAIPFLICPTRRKPIAYPYPNNWGMKNAGVPTTVNKTDYVANGGSNRWLLIGPQTIDCLKTFPVCNDWYVNTLNQTITTQQLCDHLDDPSTGFNGISGALSEVSSGAVPDGLSNVFFAGEKYLTPDLYYTGTDGADNDSCFQGNDWDTNRWVMAGFPPMRDTRGVNSMSSGFGAAHPAGCHFVFCDGHVQLLSYQINFTTYQSLGVRNDGTYSEDY